MLEAYVTRSIFQQRSEKKGFASFNELLNFFSKHKPPTVICLFERATERLINFKQQSQADFVGSKELFKCDISFPNSDTRHE